MASEFVQQRAGILSLKLDRNHEFTKCSKKLQLSGLSCQAGACVEMSSSDFVRRDVS